MRQSGTSPRVLRLAGLGALAGFAVASLITYLPMLLAGDGYYEHGDVLVAFGAVLVPLGAGGGALWSFVSGPADRNRSPTTVLLATAGFVVLLLALWHVWSMLTGAPALI